MRKLVFFTAFLWCFNLFSQEVNRAIVEQKIGKVGLYDITYEVLDRLEYVGKELNGVFIALHYFFQELENEKEMERAVSHYCIDNNNR